MSLSVLSAVVSGFAFGVGIESLLELNEYVSVWLLSLSLIVALVWRRASRVGPAPFLIICSVFFLATALGLVRTQFFETQFGDTLKAEVGQIYTFTGQVAKEPDRRSSVQMLTVHYEGTNIRVSTDRNLPVQYGDAVIVTGTLEYPTAFTTDLGRTFDYAGYLRAKEIEYVVSFAEVNVVESGLGDPVVSALLALKQRFMAQLDMVLTEPAGALADGLLLGLNQGLGDTLETDFRRSGIIHIVVLSGYNIMLVVTFVMFLLSFLLRKHWRLLVGLAAIIAFALIVGLSATVVRASIMASLLLIAQTFGRSYDVLRALLVAGLIMLFINPYLLLFDIGFQLSFMATLGLIASLPLMSAKEQPELLTSARGYVVATIATQIAVLPLLVYHIGEVSVVAVLVNVLVLPAVPFAMLGSFVAALTSTIWLQLGLVFGFFTELLLTYIIVVAQTFAGFSFATIAFSAVSPWWIGILYGLIGLGYWWFMVREPKQFTELSDWEIVEETENKVGADQGSAPTEESVPKLLR